ncbi:putative phosphatase regulatory subunit-domain-containing protein [Thamnidium elegans]|nr:putative phosphatase regulatory subunit-domain-containing protein [Thamnidium elegans]
MSTTYHRRVALMKRPPLVRNSSPIISYIKPKKSVRFCDESLENVRLFLKTQMPKACQSDPTTNDQTYSYHLQLLNWPKDNKTRTTSAVRVEHLQLLPTMVLIGTCQVANLAFEKHVVIHYTLDDWITVNEIQATYKESIMQSWDRFSFKIVLNTTYHKSNICLAVKYTVLGREFWDNNQENDFKMSIVPKIQLHFDDDDCSSSSSSDEEEEQKIKPSFGHRYNLNAAVKKPWSPPLSPTTPVDASPLWIDSSINNKNKNGYFTDPNEYHELIRRYCFNAQQTMYNDPIHS